MPDTKLKCAVDLCSSKDGPFYRFPRINNDQEFERCLKWISATGNSGLLKLSHEKLQNRRICIKHFELGYRMPSRLTKFAVPTLELPTPLDLDSVMKSEVARNHISTSLDKNNENNAECSFASSASSSTEPKVSNDDVIAESSAEEEIHNISEIGQAVNVDPMEVDCDTKESTGRESEKRETKQKGKDSKKKSAKKRRSILSVFRVSKKEKLNERDRQLYSLVTHLSRQVRIANKKNEQVQERLRRAEAAVDTGYMKILDEMAPVVKNFILCHFRNAKVNKFKRKFTLKDKVFALSLYKRSASTYRYMSKVFCLPSTETVRKLSSELFIKPGLCDSIFDNLKVQAEKRAPGDRYCTLMMDEVAISMTILLNKSKDMVEGFVDDGTQRKSEIADHASVWMLKGVPKDPSEKPWKQPIAFSFCKSTMNVADIMRTYKDIVRRVKKTGFQVIVSVCDQGSTNQAAINTLISDTKAAALRDNRVHVNDSIVIDNDEIVHLFDPPHLLKCLRNNLLRKKLKFDYKGQKREASWDHIICAYEIDKSFGQFRILKKVTDVHVYESKMKKMKVKNCAQIFSHTVASTLVQFSRNQAKSKCGRYVMSEKGEDTGYLCLFLDEVFDSVNGTGLKNTSEEESLYKGPILTKDESAHEELWNSSIKVLQSMQYVQVRKSEAAKPPCLINWIHTLKGFKILRKNLAKFGFTSFGGRLFNQDPLENFFCQIKQHGGRNKKPNCVSFQGYYKSLLVNSLVGNNLPTSNTSNCEIDSSSGSILDTESLFSSGDKILNYPSWELPPLPQEFEVSKTIDDATIQFFDNIVNGKLINHADLDCVSCYSNLFTSCEEELCTQPCYGTVLSHYACYINNICSYYFPLVSHQYEFTRKIKDFLHRSLKFDFEKCDHSSFFQHEVVETFVDSLAVQYFGFLSQILSRKIEMPLEHDSLQAKVYTASQKYQKDNF